MEAIRIILFHFCREINDTVHLFESAIDLLSYATLQKLDGKEWRREHLLSLAGVYQPAKEIEKVKSLQRWPGH